MNSLNPFQWIALTVILGLLIAELICAIRGRVIRRVWVLRVLTWIAAGAAIYWPNQVTALARAVGIQRGADLVLYLTVLVFFATSLFLYTRCLRLQQQITQIVRHIAIQEARAPEQLR
jgi:hypothetical protein